MNSRFAVAVHILTFLDQNAGEPVTSEHIAGSVNTNPSLVRRLLGMLGRAGLSTSQMGAGGGALLARRADTITLLDVYRAVDKDAELFAMHSERPNPKCPVGRNIQAVLETRIDTATRAMEAELARASVADLGRDVRRQERRRGTIPAAS